MKLLSVLFGYRAGVSMYALPILISGLVLTLLMPAASRLSELVAQPWSPFPMAFFLTYAMISSVMAMMIGAGSTPDDIEPCRSHALLRTLGRVSFGHFLMLPLIAYSRVLFENSTLPIFSMTALVYLVCVMISLLALLMEMHDARRRQAYLSPQYTKGLRYSVLFVYFTLPLLGLISNISWVHSVALLSPIGSLIHLLADSVPSPQWGGIFAIPVCAITVSLVILFKMPQGRIHV